MSEVVAPKGPVHVTPKPGTVLWHGHGQHGFSDGKPIGLPAHEAEALVEHGLVDRVPVDEPAAEAEPAAALPAPDPAAAAEVASTAQTVEGEHPAQSQPSA